MYDEGATRLLSSPLTSALRPSEVRVFVLGAGGHAKIVVSTLLKLGVKAAGIFDDDPSKQGTKVLSVPVLGPISSVRNASDLLCVIGVGDNTTRHNLAASFPSARWLTVIHPKASVSEPTLVGPGTVIVAGAVIQPGARIGRHCIINTGATLDSDCVIGDFCHVAPGCHLGRAVTLAEGVFVGIGTVAVRGTCVGAWTTLGAGAAVVADLPDRVLGVGVPAQVRRKLEAAGQIMQS